LQYEDGMLGLLGLLGRLTCPCIPAYQQTSPTPCANPTPTPPTQVEPLPDPSDTAAATSDPEGHWAARMLQLVRSKATPEEIDAWKAEQVGKGGCWGSGEGGIGVCVGSMWRLEPPP